MEYTKELALIIILYGLPLWILGVFIHSVFALAYHKYIDYKRHKLIKSVLVNSTFDHSSKRFKGEPLKSRFNDLILVEELDLPREDDGTVIENPLPPGSKANGMHVPYVCEESKSLIERHDEALKTIEELRIQLDDKDAKIRELNVVANLKKTHAALKYPLHIIDRDTFTPLKEEWNSTPKTCNPFHYQIRYPYTLVFNPLGPNYYTYGSGTGINNTKI